MELDPKAILEEIIVPAVASPAVLINFLLEKFIVLIV
jgi:hypothetical protein